MKNRRDKDYDPGVLLTVLGIIIVMLMCLVMMYGYYDEFLR